MFFYMQWEIKNIKFYKEEREVSAEVVMEWYLHKMTNNNNNKCQLTLISIPFNLEYVIIHLILINWKYFQLFYIKLLP